MIAGEVLRLLLLYAIVRASISDEENRKMRTALAASFAGIHGAILNLPMAQSIRADIGDLLLVFGEYRGIRISRYIGFLVIDGYLALAGRLMMGALSYYLITASMAIIPVKTYISKRRSPRLILLPF